MRCKTNVLPSPCPSSMAIRRYPAHGQRETPIKGGGSLFEPLAPCNGKKPPFEV